MLLKGSCGTRGGQRHPTPGNRVNEGEGLWQLPTSVRPKAGLDSAVLDWVLCRYCAEISHRPMARSERPGRPHATGVAKVALGIQLRRSCQCHATCERTWERERCRRKQHIGSETPRGNASGFIDSLHRHASSISHERGEPMGTPERCLGECPCSVDGPKHFRAHVLLYDLGWIGHPTGSVGADLSER